MRHSDVNSDMRRAIANRHLTLWQVADLVGVHFTTINSWMRKELSAERKERIEDALTKYDSITTGQH